MSLDAMKLALEVLSLELPLGSHLELKSALRAAIKEAQGDGVCRHCSGAGCVACDARHLPEQEPVAWMNPSWIDPDTRGWESDSFNAIPIEGWVPLYTAPRQWQGLTDEEIYLNTNNIDRGERGWAVKFARSIEAKLREKNNG